jgi:hypothetical protein
VFVEQFPVCHFLLPQRRGDAKLLTIALLFSAKPD